MHAILAAGLAAGVLVAASLQSKPAAGRVSVTDPSGDVNPIRTSKNETFPGMDVVKLDIESDGTIISVAATLTAPPPRFASDVVQVFVDADRAATGVALINPKIGGFDYLVQLHACVRFADSSSTCAGGSMTAGAAVESRYASIFAWRYKGSSETDGQVAVQDSFAMPPAIEAPRTPVNGNLIRSTLPYGAIGVKSGQTIRLLVRESGTYPTRTGELQGFFPEILLTLK